MLIIKIDQITELFKSLYYQIPTGTNRFFEWYFYGLQGLGGWLIFLLLALVALIWLFYDSQSRRLPAVGWRMSVILLVLLVLPSILYRFTVTPLHFEIHNVLKAFGEDECPIDIIQQNFPEVQSFVNCNDLQSSLPPLTPFGEYVFYLGLLGGVLAPVLAIGYFITFQGLVGCPEGHVYEEELGQCPHPSHQPPLTPLPPAFRPPPLQRNRPTSQEEETQPPDRPRQSPARQKVNDAWLVDLTNNRRYDIYEDSTRIGRKDDNDIVIKDPSIARAGHVQIRHSHGHCTLYDLGSKSGTFLNGARLRNPQVLQNGDEITIGDTILKYVSGQ